MTMYIPIDLLNSIEQSLNDPNNPIPYWQAYQQVFNYLQQAYPTPPTPDDANVMGWLNVAIQVNSDAQTFASVFVRENNVAADVIENGQLITPFGPENQASSDAVGKAFFASINPTTGAIQRTDDIAITDANAGLQVLGLSPAAWAGAVPPGLGDLIGALTGFYDPNYFSRLTTAQQAEAIAVHNLALNQTCVYFAEQRAQGIPLVGPLEGAAAVCGQAILGGGKLDLGATSAYLLAAAGKALDSVSPYAAKIASIFGISMVDPIVLDLSGNGVQLISQASSNAYFDLYGTGFAVHTGWVGPQTGFLVVDSDGNGKIDNITELFGSLSTDGFTALNALDANHDGVINASDPGFSTLEVWTDTNGNGVTDPGELRTLAQVGITSINLATSVQDQTVNGNVIH